MKITSFFAILSTVFAKKFIVQVEPELTTDIKALTNFFAFENVVTSVTIGDFHAYIVESTNYFSLFEYPFVKNVEEDQFVTIYDHVSPLNLQDNSVNQNYLMSYVENTFNPYYLQSNPVWNLDRIDQRPSNLDTKYFYTVTKGSGVNVYVIDTGIDITHSEFGGRAVWGTNTVDNNNVDCNNHGTHVSGTIGSATYGVSKGATLVAVKALDCNGSGTYSGILAGMEWVVNAANKTGKPSVVNMSLGGGQSSSINQAVAQMTAAGIHVVVAAGNENQNACNTSPASEPSAITVAALDQNGPLAYFSNWGTCVDIIAPGTNILSTFPGGKTAVLQGTSMASPHVAGAVANFLGDNPGISPAAMQKGITAGCTQGMVTGNLNGTPNCLLYTIA